MSAAARYRIPDEPRPSAQENLIVDPLWPLFAQMLVGTWLALPWFVFNGYAMGSPTLRREGLLAGTSLAGSGLLLWMIVRAAMAGWFDRVDPEYAKLSIFVLKLGCAYALYQLQARPFQLWQHFGGRAKNGLPLLIGAMFLLKPSVNAALGDGIAWILLR